MPVNTLLRPSDYAFLLNDSRARVAIVSHELLSQLQAIDRSELRYLKHVVVAGPAAAGYESLSDLMRASGGHLDPEPTSKDDSAFWLYSSGSTGFPKGCVHLQHDMVVCVERYAKGILGITADDRCFSVAKLYFAYGLGNGLYFPLAES